MHKNEANGLKTPEEAAREWLETVDENGSFRYSVTATQVAGYGQLTTLEKLEWVAQARLFTLAAQSLKAARRHERLRRGKPSTDISD